MINDEKLKAWMEKQGEMNIFIIEQIRKLTELVKIQEQRIQELENR